MKKLISAAATKTGRRPNNQDNYMLCGEYAELEHDTCTARITAKSGKPFFAAVCDGMGGESSGERASFEACADLADSAHKLTGDFSADKLLVANALLGANSRLCSVMKNESTERMGSTAVCVLIEGDSLFFTNLGDSRLYLLRDGGFKQLTADHTEGQLMVDAGVLTPEQLREHPARNKLNRHLGIFPEEMVLECPKYSDIELKAGDKLLLCSDGVYGSLSDEEAAELLGAEASAEDRTVMLVDSAYSKGSRDNMTALVIDVEGTVNPIIPAAAAVLAAGVLIGGFFAVRSFIKPGGNGDQKPDKPTSTSAAESETEEPFTEEPAGSRRTEDHNKDNDDAGETNPAGEPGESSDNR